jgi:hypothetical protein
VGSQTATAYWKTVGVTRRRLPLIALVVAVLVAIVALVAHGRPLAAGAGHHGGLSVAFWDYALTSLIIVFVLICVGVLLLLLEYRPDPRKEPRRPHPARNLVTIATILAIGVAFAYAERHGLFAHRPPDQQPNGVGKGTTGDQGGKLRPGTHTVSLRWDEVAVVFGLILVAGAIFAVTRGRREPGPLPDFAPEAVAAALDESLDDLRADPDLRRAIVAAYARMERALGAAGVPRRPSEAPLEYLERALLALDTSGPAVRRLTDLFEWARFSQHEPEPGMRDDAVDALEAVRDELRAPTSVAA